MVPELEAVFLEEVRVAGRLAHDLAGRRLLVTRRPRVAAGDDERGARGGRRQAAELAVLEEAIRVRLGGHQPDLKVR